MILTELQTLQANAPTNDISYSVFGSVNSANGTTPILYQNRVTTILSALFTVQKGTFLTVDYIYFVNNSDNNISGISLSIISNLLVTKLINTLTIPKKGMVIFTDTDISIYDENGLKLVKTSVQVINNNIVSGGGGGANNAVFSPIALGEDLGGGILVYLDINSFAFKYNQNNAALYGKTFGLTNLSGLTNEIINVVTSGECSQLGGLIPGDSYFAANNGLITNIIPVTGIIQPVGVAKDATTLILNIEKSYIRI